MSVIYQEITDPLLIPECVALQNSVFNLSAEDSFPSSFYSLLIRKEHPLGLMIGCFISNEKKEKKLVGLATLMADTAPNSLYFLTFSFIPEFQNGIYPFKLAHAVKDIALERNFYTIYGIYDPLESNLGKLYTRSGAIIHKYIPTPYNQNSAEVIPIDKVLFEWKINDPTIPALNISKTKLSFVDITEKYPIAANSTADEKHLLIEIPNNFIELKNKDLNQARLWRSATKELLNEYLNKRQYTITNCISGRINDQKKTFYILSKN